MMRCYLSYAFLGHTIEGKQHFQAKTIPGVSFEELTYDIIQKNKPNYRIRLKNEVVYF